MSEAFFVSKAFFENAFEKIKRFREKTIVLKNDTGSTPNWYHLLHSKQVNPQVRLYQSHFDCDSSIIGRLKLKSNLFHTD